LVDDIEEFQEKERREEKQRFEQELRKIKQILSGREEIYEDVKDELDEEIRRQKNRLSRAKQSDEEEIRGILGDLYRERRKEVLGNWRDCESWRERQLYLEREISEIESVLDLDLE